MGSEKRQDWEQLLGEANAEAGQTTSPPEEYLNLNW
jgi:hypothetical protein